MSVLLKIFGGITLVSFVVAVATNYLFLAGIPAFLILVYWTTVDFRAIFFFLFALIPFSTEVALPGGFQTDLPTEPLIVGLMLVYVLHFLKQGKELRGSFTRHPITLFLLLHVGWIFVTAITSQDVFISLKFFLAKLWYVAVFYFMAAGLLKQEKDIKLLFWVIVIPLCLTILYVLARQATQGFAFKLVDKAVRPFYRNHVNYACLMALFVPLLWYARSWYQKYSFKWWFIVGATILVLVGINFSYTRAAYGGIIIALGAWYIIRRRLMKVAIGLAVAIGILGVTFMATNNNYLYYSPTYEKTIRHVSFDNLVAATFQGKDISTMERVYRWIAGAYMLQKEPLTGFGPGTFTEYYKGYTVTSFRTYVSENPENSGIHCYYLMVFVEQGTPGFLIFMGLCFYFLIKGEHIYHQTKDPTRKGLVMVFLMTMVIINSLLIINDMVETDKVGPFFFVCLAVLVNIDLENKRESKKLEVKEK